MTGDDWQHEDWKRFNCFCEARKIMKGAITEDIIEEAKKIEQYVSGRAPENVVKLVRGRGRK